MEPIVNPYQTPDAPLVAELVTPYDLPPRASLPPGAVGFSGAITVAEALEADRLLMPWHLWRLWGGISVLVVVSIWFALAAAAGWPDREAVFGPLCLAILMVGMAGFIAMQRLRLLRLARRRYEQRYGSYGETTGYVSPEELVTHTPFASSTIRWPAFSGYKSSPQVALLFWDNAPGFLILVRGKFASDEDWRAALAIIASRVGPI